MSDGGGGVRNDPLMEELQEHILKPHHYIKRIRNLMNYLKVDRFLLKYSIA